MTRNLVLVLSLSIITFFSSCSNSTNEEVANELEKFNFDYGQDIENIIDKMSIEEKVGQMTQINIDVISKGEVFDLVEPHELDPVKLDSAVNHYYVGSILNVGGHTYSREHWRDIISQIQEKATSEGNHLPVIYGIDAIHGVNYTKEATLFPQEIGQAATWNPSLVEEGASITAYECRASGIPWNFSPVLDLGRNPLWSRFFETYGEDVYLAKEMSKACIRGYQGEDPSNDEKVAACMKHFVGYSMTLSGKDRTPAWIPERQLREYFLPTFEEAIEQNALTVMINSGEMNGIPVHANKEILTTLLRDELKFKGLAITDWEDIIKLYRDHKVAKNMPDAVKLCIDAGIDMSMTPNDYSFNKALIKLVKNGEVTEERLNESCRRILWVKKQLGLLDRPVPDFDKYDKFASDQHRMSALNTALESITLLKNHNNLLPISKDANVLVCGPAANSLNALNGAWTHTWQGVDTAYNTKGVRTIFEALKNNSNGMVHYVKGSDYNEVSDLDNAVAVGKSVDVIVVCLGELPCTEKPGDIEDLNLPLGQKQLVLELAKLNKPIIFTLVLNRPRIIQDIEPKADAIIHAYLPGDQGGEAISKILFGDVNPSGKLPFTYPRHTGSLVPYDHKHTEKLDKNFGHEAFNPQWQFGFGLSYTKFEYQNLTIDKEEYRSGETIKVGVDVHNIGNVVGKEVVQVYVSDLVASITPSVKRLRAFNKISLDPGEKKHLEFEIHVSDLSFVDANNNWLTESGDFKLSVNALNKDFSVK